MPRAALLSALPHPACATRSYLPSHQETKGFTWLDW